MKTVFTLIICLLTLCSFSQPTFSSQVTGLTPEIHNALTDVIYTKKVVTGVEVVKVTSTTTKNGVKTTTSRLTMRYAKVQTFTEDNLALNLGHTFKFDNGYNQVATTDTAEVLVRTLPNGWWAKAYVSKSGTKRYMTCRSRMDSLYAYIGGKAQYIKRPTLDSLSRACLGLTIEQLENKVGWNYVGQVYNPQVYLTSFFPYFTVVNGQVTNYSFVNGQPFSEVNAGNLKYTNGTNIGGFGYVWFLYNGCTQTGANDGIGNWGLCVQSPEYLKLDPLATSITIQQGSTPSYSNGVFNYAPNSQKIIALNMGLLPNSLRNGGSRIYYNLSTNQIVYNP